MPDPRGGRPLVAGRVRTPGVLRRAVERRLRGAWTRPPGPALRAAAALYGAAADARTLAYDAGIAKSRRAAVPVVSVGGLTVGGSGKTPVAAALGRWLTAAGRRAAIVTRGYPDEIAVHRVLNPDALVLGHPDRLLAVREAVRRGARVAVLDDGFQHRRLARDLDIVLVDVDALVRTNGWRLPAGPFRDDLRAVARADAAVCVRRSPAAGPSAALADALGRFLPHLAVGRCALVPDRLVPANGAAAGSANPEPAVAAAGVMKPRLFFQAIRARWPGVERLRTFPDHRGPGPEEVPALLAEAGDRGIVCTLKDVPRLLPEVGERTPLWYLADGVDWETGESVIRGLVLQASSR